MESDVSLRNGSALLLGMRGSGKTRILAAFLKEDPQESNLFQMKTVRAVAHCKAEVVSDNDFVRITDDYYSDILIATLPQPINTSATPFTQAETKGGLNNLAYSSSLSQKETMRQAPAVKVDISGREDTVCVHHAMKRLYLRKMLAGGKKMDLTDKELLDVTITEGQPMFHEVLPVFIQNTKFVILIVKLNEPLDKYLQVEYYVRGKRIGGPFNSRFTHLDMLYHCMRAIRSTCDHNTNPKIAIVGTHKDDCPQESREIKEKQLRSIIPREMEVNFVTQGKSMLLAIDAKNLGNEDADVISVLRRKVTEKVQEVESDKISLQYFPLEMAFQRIAKEQQKSVMSKEECFKVATSYNFTRTSFEAALKYLHGLKLIFYYEKVLPNVVFTDAQAILDIITELVVHNLSLQDRSIDTRDLFGPQKKFVRCGIVTAQILETLSSYYVPKLFMKEQLILLFKHLRIMVEVGKGEYLMPCLLKKQDIPRLMAKVSSLGVPALLFYFGKDGPKLGVYFFLLASLITEANWKFFEEDGYPMQVSCNQAQFALPGKFPGCVTITDPFSSYFHVVIELETPEGASTDGIHQIYKEVCPLIHEKILIGIQNASKVLDYDNSIEIAFPCTMHNSLHPATISGNRTHLICTSNTKSISEVTEQHKLWFSRKGISRDVYQIL